MWCASGFPIFSSSAAVTLPLSTSGQVGAVLKAGEEAAAIETIKVNVSLPSPPRWEGGRAQPRTGDGPGDDQPGTHTAMGGCASSSPADWDADRVNLLDANRLFCPDEARSGRRDEKVRPVKQKVAIVPCSGIGKFVWDGQPGGSLPGGRRGPPRPRPASYRWRCS